MAGRIVKFGRFLRVRLIRAGIIVGSTRHVTGLIWNAIGEVRVYRFQQDDEEPFQIEIDLPSKGWTLKLNDRMNHQPGVSTELQSVAQRG